MGTGELLKLSFYNMAADFYIRLSSRHSAKASLLCNKAKVYIEKQKEIFNKHE